METIGAWLNRLGLGAYETAFEANRIDLKVATKLSNADLKDLGVRALGDRKRLFRPSLTCGRTARRLEVLDFLGAEALIEGDRLLGAQGPQRVSILIAEEKVD